jgi:hypothetical protein
LRAKVEAHRRRAAAVTSRRVQRGSAVVSIHVLAERGVLLLLARGAAAPAPERAAELWPRLLEASFDARWIGGVNRSETAARS